MAAVSETGAQLFARLGEKPSLAKLIPKIIPSGLSPMPGDVVEVYGISGSGKTELLLNFAANCILPSRWNGVDINGLGTSVVFIDTDHQFSMLRFFAILEGKVGAAIAERTKHGKGNGDHATGENTPSSTEVDCFSGVTEECLDSRRSESDAVRTKRMAERSNCEVQFTVPLEEEVESFLKACLKRLYVVKISTSKQFVVTLLSLESLLASQSDISVMMIDSVSAFYWLDRMQGDGQHNQSNNQKLIFSTLSRLVHDYHLVLFATKAALIAKQPQNDFSLRLDARFETDQFNQTSTKCSSSLKLSTEHQEFLGTEWTKLVTHRIILERHDRMSSEGPLSSYLLMLKQKASGNVYSCEFSVDQQGILS